MNVKDTLLTVGLSSLMVNVCASPLDKLPRGCMNEGYEFKFKMLNLYPPKAGNSDSIYVIYNNYSRPVYLFQARGKDTYQGNELNGRILPKKYALYAGNEDEVKFICTIPNKKYLYGEIVDCQDKLKVCEYSGVLFGMNNRGNYWMVDSAGKGRAIKQSIRHGVILSHGHY